MYLFSHSAIAETAHMPRALTYWECWRSLSPKNRVLLDQQCPKESGTSAGALQYQENLLETLIYKNEILFRHLLHIVTKKLRSNTEFR